MRHLYICDMSGLKHIIIWKIMRSSFLLIYFPFHYFIRIWLKSILTPLPFHMDFTRDRKDAELLKFNYLLLLFPYSSYFTYEFPRHPGATPRESLILMRRQYKLKVLNLAFNSTWSLCTYKCYKLYLTRRWDILYWSLPIIQGVNYIYPVPVPVPRL